MNKYSKKKSFLFQIEDLLHRYLDRVLEFKRLNCKEQVPTNELNLIQSFTRLMDCLAVPPKKGQEQQTDDTEETLTKMWFFFCMVWSIGATLDEAGRQKFDSYIREMDGIFPVVDTVYDYFVNTTVKAFVHWKANLSSDWTFPEGSVFSSLSTQFMISTRQCF